MQPISVFFRWFFFLALAMVMLGMGAFFVINQAQVSREQLPVYGDVIDFSLTAHTGTPFSLADMQGKISIVDFIFTSCPMACPRMSTEMSELYHQFADAPEVLFVSISVDPENDTLERLQEYAGGYGVTDNRWVFLRGPIEDVAVLSEKGFSLGAEFPMNHSTKFVMVDPAGKIRGYYDSFEAEEMEQLKVHLQQLRKSNRRS